MSIEILVPNLPESVADAVLLDWRKQPGDAVARDEILVEVETDKVVLEVPSPSDGVLSEIVETSGTTVTSQQVLARVEEGAAAEEPEAADDAAPAAAESAEQDAGASSGPAVRNLLASHGLSASAVTGTGPNGRISKEDVLQHVAKQAAPSAPAQAAKAAVSSAASNMSTGEREVTREPMSRLRQTIANRLVQSQQNAALLTTFNEVDMAPVMALRKQHKEAFEATHGAKLGFMSFFVKASVMALQRFPLINAYIEGNEVVKHNYVDISIAVSSPRGLVVPVLRNCDRMGFADIESTIADFGQRAQELKLEISELQGGTFTISNGGIFGSLLSTPIVNPPQSAILGMHKIQQRPVVVDGEIVIRPMMYLALTYDHRIVDGKEAVQFLVSIKESLEDPARMLLAL